jgi:uncharacterized protein (TIGR04255 family)
MNDDAPLPRFRNPPVSEVALGVQFPAVLNPVHLGLYYQRVKARFPKVQVQPPIAAAFETFAPSPTVLGMPVPTPIMGLQPRMWFLSEDENSLIQLQSDRLLYNWRGGLQGVPYPHFEAVHAEFVNAFDILEALSEAEGITEVVVNQCEVLYVNRLPTANTGVTVTEPERIFRVLSNQRGREWDEPREDLSFIIRYRLNDAGGKPFGRLTAVAASSSSTPQIAPGFQLEMVARGVPQGTGRQGIAAFHDHGHRAIVRCFAAITTPEMHKLWERYQ